LSNDTKQSTITTPTTTTATTTTTTVSDGLSSRCRDTNVRRWLHTAMPHSQHSSNDRLQPPHRSQHNILNRRPSSTVLDAIRAIEARQLPLSDPAALPTTQNGDYRSSAIDRRTGCRLVDIARRSGCMEAVVGSLQAAGMIQPATALRLNELCQQRQVRSQDLGQGHFEGQFERVSFQPQTQERNSKLTVDLYYRASSRTRL